MKNRREFPRTVLASPRKYPKKATPGAPPLRFAAGSPAMLAFLIYEKAGACGTRPRAGARGLRQSSATAPKKAALLGVAYGDSKVKNTPMACKGMHEFLRRTAICPLVKGGTHWTRAEPQARAGGLKATGVRSIHSTPIALNPPLESAVADSSRPL